MKIAFVHDWLNGMRGGEKCLEALCELFPESPIYTLFCEEGKLSPAIAERLIYPSFLQRYPGIFKHYRYYLPLFPRAMESLELGGYDFVISVSHCAAKGFRKERHTKHLSYCLTPMRYAWTHFEDYFGGRDALSRSAIRVILERLREWDLQTSQNVDKFVAISKHVRNRILDFYGKEAEVIYPPVDTDFYAPHPALKPQDFYLVVSALVPYKRVDLAIEAFNRLGKRLVIVGEGPEKPRLRKMASSRVKFVGWQPNRVIRDYYRQANAVIFPGEEDFGIVPVEAQASGSFVIAFRKGGALETVIDNVTGIFFESQAIESLCEAVLRFEKAGLVPQDARLNAERFGRERFKKEMSACLENFLERPALAAAG